MVRRRKEAEVHRLWPAWVQSLGAIKTATDKDPHLRIQAMCGTCNTAFRVDIEAMIWKLGRDFSLINQHGRCKRMGCNGRTVFQYSNGSSTPFQTMTDTQLSK